MNNRLFLITSFLSAAILFQGRPALAQTTAEAFKTKYERQVKYLGYDGVGVETILTNWENAFPDDPDMLVGWYNFNMQKALTTEVVAKDRERFMGAPPSISLKDSTGRYVHYFEENFYDEARFGLAQKALDRLIELYPRELSYRFLKISSLILYEKEDPVLATSELLEMIGQDASGVEWTYNSEKIGQDEFPGAVQEYCYTFYTIASPVSYQSFHTISSRMLEKYPDNTDFLSNMGAYWLTCKSNPKKALQFYNKVLKIKPEDEVALKNRGVAQRRLEAGKKKRSAR